LDARPFTDEDSNWVEARASQVREHYAALFETHADVFPSSRRLLDKYNRAEAAVLTRGWSRYGELGDVHNELSLAEALVQCSSPRVRRLDYERPLTACSKKIDFSCKLDDDERVLFIEVKTIRPDSSDADSGWRQFERVTGEGLLSPGTEVELHREWLGGELWHHMYAAREKFLEHAQALETTIRDCELSVGSATIVLGLFSNGFNWHLDELEDFVAFYRTASHSRSDPLARMEDYYVREKQVHLNRTIHKFAFFERRHESISLEKACWDVRPPILPF
jgi:hypothetical protein